MVSQESFPGGTYQLRQWPSIERLLDAVEGSPHWRAAVIVGSVATGQADAMSDVDVFILVETGAFPVAWGRRHELHDDAVVACWDTGGNGVSRAGHKWLTWDLTYMDCAVAEPEAVRLAGPFVFAAGRRAFLSRLEADPVPQQQERAWKSGGPKPVAVAYAELKDAVRSIWSA